MAGNPLFTVTFLKAMLVVIGFRVWQSIPVLTLQHIPRTRNISVQKWVCLRIFGPNSITISSKLIILKIEHFQQVVYPPTTGTVTLGQKTKTPSCPSNVPRVYQSDVVFFARLLLHPCCFAVDDFS